MSVATTSAGADVRIEQLAKVFDTQQGELRALDRISLTMAPGEFVAIVGPSGCGKSTLLRILAGLDPATSGRVTVDGDPIDGPSTKHGVVFQRPALFPWLDVLGNVTFGPRMQGRNGREVREQALRYIRAVGLEGFEHFRVFNLSGGMQHRAALARALIGRPELLLMDEPFGALDAQTRLGMQELLMRIWQEDRSTVLFITHDVDEALTMADRVVVMTARPGRIKLAVEVDLPRPRDLAVATSEAFAALKRQVLGAIREETAITERREFEAARQTTTE